MKKKLQISMKLGAIESRFADIIWNHEPLRTGELFKMAEIELGWKRQTSYTILKRLCEKGLFLLCVGVEIGV